MCIYESDSNESADLPILMSLLWMIIEALIRQEWLWGWDKKYLGTYAFN